MSATLSHSRAGGHPEHPDALDPRLRGDDESHRWNAAVLQADPLADRTVTAIGTARLVEATRLMAQWTTNASLQDWQPAGAADPDVVAALRNYLAEGSQLPAWTRPADIELAESVFMDYGPMSCTLLFCASLPQCYLLAAPGGSAARCGAAGSAHRTPHPPDRRHDLPGDDEGRPHDAEAAAALHKCSRCD